MHTFIFEIQLFSNISNSTSNNIVNGTNDSDSIINSGAYVTINGSAGNDTINSNNQDGSGVVIYGGDDHDSIVNIGKYSTIDGGNDHDIVSPTVALIPVFSATLVMTLFIVSAKT